MANGQGSVSALTRRVGGVTVSTGKYRWRLILALLPNGKPVYDEGVLSSEKDAHAALGHARKRRERGGYMEYVLEKRAEYEAGALAKAARAQAAANQQAEEPRGEPQMSTVRVYAATWLLEKENKDGLKPKTLASYAYMLNRHVLPTLGARLLTEIDVKTIAELKKSISEKGSRKKALGPRTVNQILAILSSLLSSAVKSRLIGDNPAFEELPKGPRDLQQALKEADEDSEHFDETLAWTREELARFLSATRDEWYGPAFGLMALTGMRRGEACGLRWSRVSLGGKKLRIVETTVTIHGRPTQETPKNKSSIRTIFLVPEAVDLLREWQVRQTRKRTRCQRRGESWGDSNFVITRPDGAPPNPDSLRKLFHKAGVRTITIHGLRHTYVTMMANQGMSIDLMASMVGHANSEIMRDVYKHLFESDLERAVQALPPLFGNGGGQ